MLCAESKLDVFSVLHFLLDFSSCTSNMIACLSERFALTANISVMDKLEMVQQNFLIIEIGVRRKFLIIFTHIVFAPLFVVTICFLM